MMTFSLTPADLERAKAIANDFLMDALKLSEDGWEWFSVLQARNSRESWSAVEISIEGLPDKWIFHVLDTGYCDLSYTDLSYTSYSPVSAAASDTGLEDMPDRISTIVQAERSAA